MSFNSPCAEELSSILVGNVKTEPTDAYPENDKCNSHMRPASYKARKAPSSPKERTKRPLQPGKIVGHWNYIEKKKYHWFLEMYHGHFENKHLRRMDKIFKSMADFIGTRAADQCRSHHQKMEKKFRTFYSIVYNLRIMHYSSAESRDIEADLRSYELQPPSTLIDASVLEHYLQSKDHDFERELFGEHAVKHENPFHIEMEDPECKSF